MRPKARRIAARWASSASVWIDSARAASAPVRPPISSYAATVRREPSRRSKSSASAYWSSGSGAGCPIDLRGDPCGEPGLELDTDAAGRLDDGALELVGCQGRDVDRGLLQHGREPGVSEGAVVEVGA